MEKLEGVAFVWGPNEAQWEESYEKLLRYIEENGNALVPRAYVMDGMTLGIWVDTQRQRYKKGKFSKPREDMLIENGFVWQVLKTKRNE